MSIRVFMDLKNEYWFLRSIKMKSESETKSIRVLIKQYPILRNVRWQQYCCPLLHKTSYWSRSSAVIVLLHTALFYSNFEIWWKLWNFDTFWKFYHFEFFWNLMKFLKVFKFYENFEFFFKKNEILRNFWNFKIKKKLTFKF